MAVRLAKATGNWSSTSTWEDGATLPGSGDTVLANGYTVTIDQDVTVTQVWTAASGSGCTVNIASLSGSAIATFNTTPTAGGSGYPPSQTFPLQVTTGGTGGYALVTTNSSGVVTSVDTTPHAAGTGYTTGSGKATTNAGGGFTLNDTRTLNAIVLGGTTTCVTFSANSPATATINGNVTAGTSSGAVGVTNSGTGTISVNGNVASNGGANGFGILNNSSGVVNVVGNVTNTNANPGWGIQNASTGTVNITGTVTGVAAGANNGWAVNNASTGTINLVGTAEGGSSGTNANGIVNAATGTVTVTGAVTAGSGASASGVSSATAGVIEITGTITASGTSSGLSSTSSSATNKIAGPLVAHSTGVPAVNVGQSGRYLLKASHSTYAEFENWETDGRVTLYSADQVGGQAAESDVRAGVVYGPSDDLLGSCEVPAPESVLYGVPVDDMVGSAVVTAESIRAALCVAPFVFTNIVTEAEATVILSEVP